MRDVVVARYNDLDDLDRALRGREAELAAIVVEPIVGNMGLVMPVVGFLEGLIDRAHRHGGVVIFDEVIAWLRLGLGGAQGRLGLSPDLTTVGKILGGGFPLAAFGGRRDVMAVLAPDGATFTGGTHAGNPFSIALGHRVLDFLEADPGVYGVMDGRAKRLAAGIRASLAGLELDYAVVQLESIVDFKFRPGPPTRSYDDQARADAVAYAAFYHAMRERGVLLPPSANEVMFLSVAHGDADVEQTLGAVEASLRVLRERAIL
jgi:glutamate-1-semialdehyde 2,1-aminomutase